MLKRIISVFTSTALALTLFTVPVLVGAEERSSASAPCYEMPKGTEVWDGSVAASFSGGTGTQADPFLISSAAELALLHEIVNEAVYDTFGLYYELTSDIYLNDISDCESWSRTNAPENVWTPIGYNTYEINNGTVIIKSSNAFKGVFDGGGHTVHGVYVNTQRSNDGFAPYQEGSGLFGASHYAVFHNLTLAHSFITSDAISVGGIVGWLARGGYVEGSDHSIYNCRVDATCRISGQQNVGGIIGLAQTCYQGIYSCVNSAQVTAGNSVGGIAGGVYRVEDKYLTFGRCVNYGTVTSTVSLGDSYSAGGIAGYHVGSAYECANFGNVSGTCAVGGLFGDVDVSTSVTDCYNAGTVSASYEAGGLCGVSSAGCAFTRCYNAGSVNAQYSVGAVIGLDHSSSSPTAFTNCYYLGTSCQNADKIVGTSLTEQQMRNASSYAGFDFNSVWTMEGEADYPYAELINTPQQESGPSPALAGDIDANGSVNIADAILALRASMGLITLTPEQTLSGDMDASGDITLADAIMILRASMGL